MLPVNSGGHAAYQNFVTENLRKYYPNPNAIPRSTWDIIERFWHLDLSYTDKLLRSKYSVFGPKPRPPSCMQSSYLSCWTPHASRWYRSRKGQNEIQMSENE